MNVLQKIRKKIKAIPVTGCGLRLAHFADSRLTDGGEVVSLMRRPPVTAQEDSWYSFLLEAESTPGPSAAGKIKQTEKKIQLPHRDSNLDLPASTNYCTACLK
jgi:hypothetical protein